MIPSKTSPEENKLRVILRIENSFSKIQSSLVLAIGKVTPKNKVTTSIVLSINQVLDPPPTLITFFKQNLLFNSHYSFKASALKCTNKNQVNSPMSYLRMLIEHRLLLLSLLLKLLY